MKRKYALPATAVAAVFALILASCSGGNPAAAPDEGTPPTAAPSPAPAPDTPDTPVPSQPAEEEPQVIQGSGTYIGQIDNHSVEIETEEGPTAFELGAGTENSPEGLNMNDPVVFEFVEKSIAGDETVKQRILSKLALAGNTGGSDAVPGAELPQTKKMKLILEGNPEERTAQLARGEGYALYVFDIFTFDPARNRISLTVYPEYYAEIEQLPSDYNLDNLLLEGQKELSSTGTVKVLQEADRSRYMSDVSLFLTVMDTKKTRQYIVKEIGGQGYIFKLNIPIGEASEGFPPHIYASLDSIVSQ